MRVLYSVEKTAKTVEEAKMMAISELKAAIEDVDIEVLDEGNRGFLGIIGNKLARVKATLRNEMGIVAKRFLTQIFEKMKVDVDIEVTEDENSILLKVLGDDIAIIIGRRGETLDALQYITNLAVNKNFDTYKKVIIDVENYRLKREETLKKLAVRLAEKVIKTRKSIVLEPMNPYERRIIHSTLQANDKVKTYSIGKEPYRKIVISIKQ